LHFTSPKFSRAFALRLVLHQWALNKTDYECVYSWAAAYECWCLWAVVIWLWLLQATAHFNTCTGITMSEAHSNRKWIGTMELAAKLGVHPFSIPRLRKTKSGFPQPVKPFGKNLWERGCG